MPLLPQKTEPAEAERSPFSYQQSSNHPFSLFYEHIITNGNKGRKEGRSFLKGPAGGAEGMTDVSWRRRGKCFGSEF